MIDNQTENYLGLLLADGRYRVEECLGEGAMGLIYRAEDTRLGNDVVIKVPTQRVLQDQEFIDRFQAEIRSLVQLTHPHVVKIIDVGEHEETPFVVMQFLAGGTLTDRCEQAGGKLPIDSLKEWLINISDAVDFVHRQDAIHRDVKPSNILFDSHGNAFLADFGLSKVIGREATDEQANRLTATGFVVGTPQYVAPEIVMGHAYDGRADQYSLAMTVYEAIAGESPVAGSTPSATMVNQINVVPPLLNQDDPSVPVALAKAVARGLEKDPQKRFRSCRAFAEAVLLPLETGEPSPANRRTSSGDRIPTSKAPRPKRPPQRERPVMKSKGRPGRVPCPKCKKVLPLQQKHRGRKGRCIHCRTKLQVGKDLASLTILEDVNDGRGLPPRMKRQGGKKHNASKDSDTLLGEEIFGWRINKTAASIVAVVLIVLLVGLSIYIGRKTSEPESKEKNVPALRGTESS